MNKYDPKTIEPKWRQIWSETGLNKTAEDPGRENFYCLVMFPYPSGDLHAGHWYNFGPGDTMARFYRMQGKNVLHPMGFDAFGLPAENAAIKRGIPPAEWTDRNIETMTKQLQVLGAMYDWEKSVVTSQPDYYRWTQWLFLQLHQKGLAYRAKGWQNWCPSCQTVLANEQVVGEGNVCERCGTPVVKKELEQWFFKITDYADRLLADLDKVVWPERVKTMQTNWIGKSSGATVKFQVDGSQDLIEVYTTRPDTLFGATYLVLAPEHPLVEKVTADSERVHVRKYVKEALSKTELDRVEDKGKSGVFTGGYAINPVNAEKIPIWIADYVLMVYGTGAIMAVPAHDERDFEFAQKFDLPIRRVIASADNLPYAGEGKLVESAQYNGIDSAEARRGITEYLYQAGHGRGDTKYRLRDWLISRQRYWGTPIPIIYCDNCGTVPVPEDQLPVELPLDVKFQPTGKSPLADRPDFYKADCPECGNPARRETDTMDTFVDSSWYFLRYPDNQAETAFSPEAVKQWLPVDLYIGGVEHAILHLLYARFITKVLHDQKMIDFDEPFKRLFNQGIILGPDGQKMSKSRGNVVNPDDWVAKYGADTFRMYLMFMGPYDQGGPFDPQGIAGTYRFLGRVWSLTLELAAAKQVGGQPTSDQAELEAALLSATHRAIKKVTEDTRGFQFNTAIATLMQYLNELYRIREDLPVADSVVWRETIGSLLRLLAPYAPHLAEELWHQLGQPDSVHLAGWPEYDPSVIKDDLAEIVIQVNGRVRGTMPMPAGATEEEITRAAREIEAVSRHLDGKKIARTVVVPRKLVNFVVK